MFEHQCITQTLISSLSRFTEFLSRLQAFTRIQNPQTWNQIRLLLQNFLVRAYTLLFCLHHLNTFIYILYPCCLKFRVIRWLQQFFCVQVFMRSLKYKDENHSSHHLCHQTLVSSISSICGPSWPSDYECRLLIIRCLTAVGFSLTRDTCGTDKFCLWMVTYM